MLLLDFATRQTKSPNQEQHHPNNRDERNRRKKHHRDLVDVDLEEHRVGVLGGHRLERRLHEAARSAPRRREVDHHLPTNPKGKNNQRGDREVKRTNHIRLGFVDHGDTSLLVWEWDSQFWVHSPTEWTAMTAETPSSAA